MTFYITGTTPILYRNFSMDGGKRFHLIEIELSGQVSDSILCIFFESSCSLQEKKKCQEIFDYCMQVFKDDLVYTNTIRQMAVQRLLLPLLEHAFADDLQRFYVTHIRHMVECVEEKFNIYISEEFEKQLLNKTCSYDLLALMYQKLDKDALTSITSPIVLAFLPKPATGRELTTAISK